MKRYFQVKKASKLAWFNLLPEIEPSQNAYPREFANSIESVSWARKDYKILGVYHRGAIRCIKHCQFFLFF
jgi:hypothetical protein